MASNKGKRLRFSKEEDEIVISEVSKHPALYDAKHKLYKDQNVRDSTWIEISIEVGKSVEDCKKRWKSLKDVYWKKKKETKQGTGSSARQRNKWEHMDALAFLERIETCRNTVSNVTVSGEGDVPETAVQSEDENVVISDSQQDGEETHETPETDTQFETNSNLKRSSESLPSVSGVPTCKEKEIDKQKNFRYYREQFFVLERKELFNKIESALQKTEKPHPVKLFFASMTETVMTFPVDMVARAKMRVLEVITELELENDRPAPSRSSNSDVSSPYNLDNTSSVEQPSCNDCAELFSNFRMHC